MRSTCQPFIVASRAGLAVSEFGASDSAVSRAKSNNDAGKLLTRSRTERTAGVSKTCFGSTTGSPRTPVTDATEATAVGR
jgi:hypothetical protein